MKERRQIEAAELMMLAANYSKSYARGLLLTTDPSELVPHRRGGRGPDLPLEQIASFQIEMNAVESAFRTATETYGNDVLNLVIATGYVSRLIGNMNIKSFLERYHSDILEQFTAIVLAVSLEPSSIES
jgi:hypothetical protein